MGSYDGAVSMVHRTDFKTAYVLDAGLGENLKDLDQIPLNGRVLELDIRTGKARTLVAAQRMPDGVDFSESAGRLFWTNIGSSLPTRDGSVMSSRLDGTDVVTLIPEEVGLHTPKQLVVVESQRKLYFCDREACRVYRCGWEGQDLEVLVQRTPRQPADKTQWCVGVCVDEQAGRVYWTQKGPSKGGLGRIFRAGVEVPAGETAADRSDIELVLDGLLEPVDLKIDAARALLYWTDRGEHPRGCSLNRTYVGPGAPSRDIEIVARHFHEPIGLELDLRQRKALVTDLGGSVYLVDCEKGGKERIHQGDGSYTGIAGRLAN